MANTSAKRQEILAQLREIRCRKVDLLVLDSDFVKKNPHAQHRQEVEQENTQLRAELKELKRRVGDPCQAPLRHLEEHSDGLYVLHSESRSFPEIVQQVTRAMQSICPRAYVTTFSFTEGVMSAPLPDQFKLPTLPQYDNTSDPNSFVGNY